MPDLNLGDLSVSAPAFAHTQRIPDEYSNSGGDHIPELRWENVPGGTRELVVVVHDPDAPMVDGFTHWVAIGIDPSSSGVGGDLDTAFVSGLNSMGDAAYMGPAPPPGHDTHHYFFHLFALDAVLADSPLPDRAAVLAAMDGHIIEQARTVGTYSTESPRIAPDHQGGDEELERHPGPDESASDTDVQAERQAEGVQAEWEHE